MWEDLWTSARLVQVGLFWARHAYTDHEAAGSLPGARDIPCTALPQGSASCLLQQAAAPAGRPMAKWNAWQHGRAGRSFRTGTSTWPYFPVPTNIWWEKGVVGEVSILYNHFAFKAVNCLNTGEVLRQRLSLDFIPRQIPFPRLKRAYHTYYTGICFRMTMNFPYVRLHGISRLSPSGDKYLIWEAAFVQRGTWKQAGTHLN